MKDNLDTMDIPAHEEEDECDDADDADNDCNSNKHSCSSKGGRQNCSKIIQSTSAHLSSILAEIITITDERSSIKKIRFKIFHFLANNEDKKGQFARKIQIKFSKLNF